MANSPNPARKWLSKAQQDLVAAERILSAPPLPGLSCFHAQQAVEKALKAVAVHLGAEEIPRIHSLLELAQALRELGGTLPFSDEQLASLDPYAVQVRYPDSSEPSSRAAEQALQLAQEVYAWAERVLGSPRMGG